MKRTTAAIGVTALAGLCLVGGPAAGATASGAGGAGAGGLSAGGGSVRVVRAAMVEHAVGSASVRGGTTTLTLDDGSRLNVPTSVYRSTQAARAALARRHLATPANTVYGSCGYSYTYLYDWSSLTYRLAVGFHVNADAVHYSWEAYVNGAGRTRYEYHYTSSGGLNFRQDWSGGHTGKVPAADLYDAETTYGAAVLWYGDVCSAKPTSDAAHITSSSGGH